MSLSEHEQKALREIEASLLADDPKFKASVGSAGTSGAAGGGVPLKALALGMVGLLVLLGGVALAQYSLWFVLLSVAGFLLMFGAGVWGLRGGAGGELADGYPASTSRGFSAPRSNTGIGARMEENFRRRFEGN